MKNSEVQDLDRRRNAMVMDCSAVQASMELVDQPSSYEPSSYERLDIWKGRVKSSFTRRVAESVS